MQLRVCPQEAIFKDGSLRVLKPLSSDCGCQLGFISAEDIHFGALISRQRRWGGRGDLLSQFLAA